MTTHSVGQATPPAAVAKALGQSAYVEIGTVYYWDETGSFSAEPERSQPTREPRPRPATPALLARLHRRPAAAPNPGRPASRPTDDSRRPR
jgi:hypothetical protein